MTSFGGRCEENFSGVDNIICGRTMCITLHSTDSGNGKAVISANKAVQVTNDDEEKENIGISISGSVGLKGKGSEGEKETVHLRVAGSRKDGLRRTVSEAILANHAKGKAKGRENGGENGEGTS